MSRVARIGVLGCANIAERFVLPAIKESDLFELVGVASRSKDKADSFSNTFNTKAYYSYDSLLQSNLDAIYIPLPNGMHYEWIKRALNKKLHVLVEKSLACDLDQVKELNQLARDNGDCESQLKNAAIYLDNVVSPSREISAHYFMATCFYSQEKKEEALYHYNFVASKPNNNYYTEALHYAGELTYEKEMYKEALVYFSTLEKLNSKYLMFHLNIWARMK